LEKDDEVNHPDSDGRDTSESWNDVTAQATTRLAGVLRAVCWIPGEGAVFWVDSRFTAEG